MKSLLPIAVASALLGGCAYYYPYDKEKDKESVRNANRPYIPTGSHRPHKPGEGTIVVTTMSKVELESLRMDPGTAPDAPPRKD
jgi:hypothetical protein